jgi:hypothetical protein
MVEMTVGMTVTFADLITVCLCYNVLAELGIVTYNNLAKLPWGVGTWQHNRVEIKTTKRQQSIGNTSYRSSKHAMDWVQVAG